MTIRELLEHVKEMLEIDTQVDWDCSDITPEDEFREILNYIKEHDVTSEEDVHR